MSRMSPAALAKMREGAMQSTRKPPTAGMTIQTSNTVVDPWLQPRLTNPFSSKYVNLCFTFWNHDPRTLWLLTNSSLTLIVSYSFLIEPDSGQMRGIGSDTP